MSASEMHCLARLVRPQMVDGVYIFKSLSSLSLCGGILLNALERSRPTRFTRRAFFHFTYLKKAERDILSALGANEFKPSGVHWSAFSFCTSDYLLSWVDILTHEISFIISSNSVMSVT